MPGLALPHTRFHAGFLSFVRELADEGRCGDASMIGEDMARHGGTWQTPGGFGAYVEEVRAEAVAPRDPGFVSHTTWWWVGGDDVLGRIDLRHELTPRLLEVGGHVGYDVRPSARRRGHGTAMLAAVLPLAARRGLDRVLVTCDASNLGSLRVIERNGGVPEARPELQRGAKVRFWVPTGPV